MHSVWCNTDKQRQEDLSDKICNAGLVRYDQRTQFHSYILPHSHLLSSRPKNIGTLVHQPHLLQDSGHVPSVHVSIEEPRFGMIQGNYQLSMEVWMLYHGRSNAAETPVCQQKKVLLGIFDTFETPTPL